MAKPASRSNSADVATNMPTSAPAKSPSGPAIPRLTAFGFAMLGGLLLFLAFPPAGLSWLGWIAPCFWFPIIVDRRAFTRGNFFIIWLAGTIHWLIMLQGIRLAHPALYAGWFALSAYLGIYLPCFIGVTRRLCHTSSARLPLLLVAPAFWAFLELLRGHLFTGFSMGLLAHTQAENTALIQVADIAGGYGLSWVMLSFSVVLFQTSLSIAKREKSLPRSFYWRLGYAGALLGGTLAYGQFRLQEAKKLPSPEKPLSVLAIQGSLDTVFDTTEEEARERVDRTLSHYEKLTREAISAKEPYDLVLWPESSFPLPELRIVGELKAPEGASLTADQFRQRIEASGAPFENVIQSAAKLINTSHEKSGKTTHLLFGGTTVEFSGEKSRSYNAALLTDEKGSIIDRYYKMKIVMFGEYIPFGEWFPILYSITPLGEGLARGPNSASMDVKGTRVMPCVCFESTVPHWVREQVCLQRSKQTAPDILVNLSNDGWFHGTSILDMHFRCNVFRAVENRLPVIVAANTGLSAHIEGTGKIATVAKRRTPETFSCQPAPDGRIPAYHFWGDLPWWLAGLLLLANFFWKSPLFGLGKAYRSQIVT